MSKEPCEWVNPGTPCDVALTFKRGAGNVMRRTHWEHGRRSLLPAETWSDARAAGLCPADEWSEPMAETVTVAVPEPVEAPPLEPVGREWINPGPAKDVSFTKIRVGQREVDRAFTWRHTERRLVLFEHEDKARSFGLVPLDEYKPEPQERWTHHGRGTKVTVGPLTVNYWIPGDTKLLPVRLHNDAAQAGLEFLGAAA